jgi:PAS domain S-box-containing protein
MEPTADDSLARRVAALEHRLAASMADAERLTKLTECFLQFGNAPLANINLLTALCGQLLGATCALYNRLCDGKLVAWGQWNTPVDFNAVGRPEGHICQEVLQQKDDSILLIRNLQASRYAETDPNVRQYHLQTYLGMGVNFAEQRVGSMCVVFQKDFIPSNTDENLMRFVSLAIGVEEKHLMEENARTRSHQSLLTILDSLNALVYVADMVTHEVLAMNKYARDVFGDGIGKICWQIFQRGQDGPCPFCPNPALLDEKGEPAGPHTWEMQNTRNGHWYEMHDTAVRWIDNRLVRIQIATDITERKAAEDAILRAKREWETTFDAVRDPIFIVDNKFRIIRANRATADRLGLSPEECIGRQCYELLHNTQKPPAPCPQAQVLRDGKPRVMEIREENLAGSFLFSVSPMYDATGKVTRSVHVAHDISELKQAEHERERLIAELTEALAQVKTLSGIIPICMYCKGIRDDQGYWNQLEKFISEHSEAKFSHSLCPKCLKEKFPELAKDMEDNP